MTKDELIRMTAAFNASTAELEKADAQVLRAIAEVKRLQAENEALRKDAERWQQSRAMFVARLENMQTNGDKWLTTVAVMGLLDDCDMLASRWEA
jgi:regulator of replication initiation timing